MILHTPQTHLGTLDLLPWHLRAVTERVMECRTDMLLYVREIQGTPHVLQMDVVGGFAQSRVAEIRIISELMRLLLHTAVNVDNIILVGEIDTSPHHQVILSDFPFILTFLRFKPRRLQALVESHFRLMHVAAHPQFLGAPNVGLVVAGIRRRRVLPV